MCNFYGSSQDPFGNPRHCWHPSGHYIYSTTQENTIVVWEVAKRKQVAVLSGHTATIRDMCLANGVLVSTGFDKTVHFWGLPEDQGKATA